MYLLGPYRLLRLPIGVKFSLGPISEGRGVSFRLGCLNQGDTRACEGRGNEWLLALPFLGVPGPQHQGQGGCAGKAGVGALRSLLSITEVSHGGGAHPGEGTPTEQVPSSLRSCTGTHTGRRALPAVFQAGEAEPLLLDAKQP